MSRSARSHTARSRGARDSLAFWCTPALGVLAGLAYLIALATGGHPLAGVAALVVMTAFSGALVVAARYSETVRGLLDRRDERITGIDIRATAVAGTALILAVVIAAIVEMARGGSGEPYTWLAAVACVTYIAAVITQRVRQ